MSVATIISLAGLAADIAGAVVLVNGLLVRDMAILHNMRELLKQERAMPTGWYRSIPVSVAFRLGSDDARKTPPAHLDDYAANFWGLSLLIIGFVLQGIGQVMGAIR
jgi:hypothetical protein